MDREGVLRSEFYRRRNAAFANHKENDRGWLIPEEVWQGWEEWNKAVYTTRRTMILRRHMSPYERADTLRTIRWNLSQSRICRSPALPSQDRQP